MKERIKCGSETSKVEKSKASSPWKWANLINSSVKWISNWGRLIFIGISNHSSLFHNYFPIINERFRRFNFRHFNDNEPLFRTFNFRAFIWLFTSSFQLSWTSVETEKEATEWTVETGDIIRSRTRSERESDGIQSAEPSHPWLELPDPNQFNSSLLQVDWKNWLE